jgi:hypothetical protein
VLDVDNDGDGFLDSIWMDLGYPIQTDIDGRRYKPLVAFLVLDLDNRLNVNAHGNGFHINRNVLYAGNLLGDVDPTATTNGLPRGQHLGPPEVSLGPLFNYDPATTAQIIASRYGADTLPGIGHFQAEPNPNIDFRDWWLVYENPGYPDVNHPYGEVYANQFVGGQFGTSMDIHGRYSIGIPQVGLIADPPIARPALDTNSNFTEPANEIASSAYEFSIVPQSRYPLTATDLSDDMPYTVHELERVLRSFDYDANMLPGRLAMSIGANLAGPQFLTTESWEVPALPVFEDPVTRLPESIIQYVYDLLVAQGNPLPNDQLRLLLAPEVRLGLPMDLNRAFGNGRDDNNNLVFDEHAQTTDVAGVPIGPPNGPAPATFDESIIGETIPDVNGTFVSLDSDGDAAAANNHLARQIFARHLYVLALLATGETDPIVPNTSWPYAGDTAKRIALAQWAINVVDFRDSDSIYTPFEFDFNPFNLNGWGVDGWLGVNPNTGTDDSTLAGYEGFVVWGAERPELLITETLVTHDVRNQDLAVGGTGGADNDFDSKLVPRATAFIELYHPWNQNDSNQRLPAELTDAAVTGINLQRTVPVSNDPVWRLLVVRGASMNQDPEAATVPEADVARRIYFVQPNLANTLPDSVGTGNAYTSTKVFFPGVLADGFVTRGGYAVIGSGGVGIDAAATDGTTFYGRRNNPGWAAELALTRRLELDPLTREVRMYHPDDGVNPVQTITQTDVATIIVDQFYDGAAAAQRSLGLSDPDDGYASFGAKTEIEDGFEFVNAAVDEPVDHNAADPYNTFKRTRGVTTDFSEMHLQRLANPLAPYHPVTNPYLTVDTKALDLFVFNGVEDASADASMPTGDQVFASSERGRIFDPFFGSPVTDPRFRRLLWQREEGGMNMALAAALPQFASLAGADNHWNSFNLYETLGKLNGSYSDQSQARFTRTPSELNSGPNPPLSFSGLTWNNRPFAGHMDLLDVPWPNSFDLLDKYNAHGSMFGSNDPYVAVPDGGEFGHLLNFYATDPASNPNFPVGMASLLDFVRVPSRFAGIRTHLNNSLLPPFNVLSRYREPGKINLNTVGNVIEPPAGHAVSPVWEALLGVFSIGTDANGVLVDGSPMVYRITPIDPNRFESARRDATNTMPSLFFNPFRSSSEWAKIPAGVPAPASPVEVSLLRPEGTGPATPLFDYPTVLPVVVPNDELPFASPTRDSFARHEVFRELANTTTTRSSVFAIWVTVGRFEVDEQGRLVGPSLVELGADTGKVNRSRGFFIIDRSIPAAYEPGHNHNIERIILTETIID